MSLCAVSFVLYHWLHNTQSTYLSHLVGRLKLVEFFFFALMTHDQVAQVRGIMLSHCTTCLADQN